MRHLTRLGRLTVTLLTVALATVGALTWHNPDPVYVGTCAFVAGVLAIGLALTICEFNEGDRRHRRVYVSSRRRID